MHRCLELALLGKGKTKTNPLVGAVLVYNDEIIGEGYHQKYGEAHAEVNCINSVSDQNIQNIKDATIYINLALFSFWQNATLCRLDIKT